MNLVKKILTKFITKKSEAEKRISNVNVSISDNFPLDILQIINDYVYESYSKNKPDILTKIDLNPGDSHIAYIVMSNNLIVTGSFYGTLNFWKFETNITNSLHNAKLIHVNTIQAHTTHLSCLVIHPHNFIISCSLNFLKMWDPFNGNLIHELDTIENVIRIDFLSDGSIITGTWEGNITIWKHNKDGSYVAKYLPRLVSYNGIVKLKVLDTPLEGIHCSEFSTEKILVITAYKRYYNIWDSDNEYWKYYFLSNNTYYCSEIHYLSGIIAISLGKYETNPCIDLIDAYTNQVLLTLKTDNLSCFHLEKTQDNEKHNEKHMLRIITGSMYGEVKIWDLEKCNDKLFRELVFMCDLGEFTLFKDINPIYNILYCADQKIIITMYGSIKIISLESIKAKNNKNLNNNMIDIFEENQVCERCIFTSDFTHFSYLVSDIIFIFNGFDTLYAWR